MNSSDLNNLGGNTLGLPVLKHGRLARRYSNETQFESFSLLNFMGHTQTSTHALLI